MAFYDKGYCHDSVWFRDRVFLGGRHDGFVPIKFIIESKKEGTIYVRKFFIL